MATVEYNAGGSDKAIKTIDRMYSDQLRSWLKQLAKKDIDLGVKIIVNGGKYCFIGGGDVYGRHLAYVDSYCRANHTSLQLQRALALPKQQPTAAWSKWMSVK